MTPNRLTRRTALALAATGPLFLAGLVLHPHAPHASNMTQVAYTQTGQAVWWPAHLFLLSCYVLFALVLFRIARLSELPPSARRVLTVARLIAAVCVLAMLIHLLLPLGRDSVAHSRHGWAFWLKDAVESLDAMWALSAAGVAWALGRAGIVGQGIPALLGVAGGIGFAFFSFLVPLTGFVVPMSFTRSVLHLLPVFGLLMVAWATVGGLTAVARLPRLAMEERVE
jgi:hypothetical protein